MIVIKSWHGMRFSWLEGIKGLDVDTDCIWILVRSRGLNLIKEAGLIRCVMQEVCPEVRLKLRPQAEALDLSSACVERMHWLALRTLDLGLYV